MNQSVGTINQKNRMGAPKSYVMTWKKAVKPNPMMGAVGGIVDKTMPIHVSNVALFNTATGKADRVGVKLVDGKRVRVYKSSGEVVKA